MKQITEFFQSLMDISSYAWAVEYKRKSTPMHFTVVCDEVLRKWFICSFYYAAFGILVMEWSNKMLSVCAG